MYIMILESKCVQRIMAIFYVLNIISNCKDIKHEAFECVLTFIVLKNIQYDLIIGRIDILEYNIWQQTVHTYGIDTGVNSASYLTENTECTKLVPVSSNKSAVIQDHASEGAKPT